MNLEIREEREKGQDMVDRIYISIGYSDLSVGFRLLYKNFRVFSAFRG